MNLEQRICERFQASIETKAEATETLPTLITNASEMMVQSFLANGKILTCGCGSSSFIAQHLTSLLMGKFERQRPGLPSISLNSNDTNIYARSKDRHFEQVLASQIRVLGSEEDILLTCCSDGGSPSIIQAIIAAHDRGIKVIALTGNKGTKITTALGKSDLEIRVTAEQTSRIQEVHLLTIHCLCDLIDHQLFGGE